MVTNSAELRTHVQSILMQLNTYQYRQQAEREVFTLMGIAPENELHNAAANIKSSLKSGLTSALITGAAKHGTPEQKMAANAAQQGQKIQAQSQAQQIVPNRPPPTPDRPWSLMPEVAQWGAAGEQRPWLKLTGYLQVPVDAEKQSSSLAGMANQAKVSAAKATMGPSSSNTSGGTSGGLMGTIIKKGLGTAVVAEGNKQPTEQVAITIWMGEQFPNCFPLIYVQPTMGATLKPQHPHVGVDGRLYSQELSAWHPQRGLSPILKNAVQIFAQDFPFQNGALEDMAVNAIKGASKIGKKGLKFMKSVLSDKPAVAGAAGGAVAGGAVAGGASGHPGPTPQGQPVRDQQSQMQQPMPQPSAPPLPPGGAGAYPAPPANGGSAYSTPNPYPPPPQGPPPNMPAAPPASAPPPVQGSSAVDPSKEKDTPATEPGQECNICLENKKAAFFLPCGHVCCCMGCSKTIKECCLCRQPIKEVFKAYI